MKKLLLAALVLISSFAQADEARYKTPASITCTAPQATDPATRKFTITKLDTQEPEIDLYSAPLQSASVGGYLADLAFSDECESAYGIILFGSDLEALKKGETKSIKGLLNYFNAEQSEILYQGRDSIYETVNIECKLAN